MKKAFLAALLFLTGITGCSGVPEQNAEEASDRKDNGIAVLSLQIDPQEFDRVNESPDHSYKASGASAVITYPDGQEETMELDYIRGRGHGTWAADKKPYRFKLKKNADLSGMGENRHWILLANRYDVSLLRNRLILYIGEQMGLAYTPQSVPVDLNVNGEYYGSYVLSEQVRIGKNRIEIDELTPEDTEEPEITGGYLLCLNPDYEEPAENIFFTDRMVRFGNEEPQFTEGETGTEEQKEYISGYLQKTEDAVFSDDSGIWKEYMDMESAASYWWIQEFSGNHDAFITSSTYLYKERNGKLYWGPLWDFDLSLGEGLDSADGFLHRNMIWLDHLRAYDPEYQKCLREKWTVLDQIIDEAVKDNGVIDTYAEEIRKSWEADQLRWPIMDENEEPVLQDLDYETGRLKNWMKRRQKWIRENIDQELTHVYQTVTFMADDEIFRKEEILSGMQMNRLPEAPYREGYIFSHWEYENGTPYDYEQTDHDLVLNAVYLPQEEAGITEGIYFVNPQEAWADLCMKIYDPVYELLPEGTKDKSIQWSVSDENLAEADESGKIRLKGTGEVTVTGKLYTGAENSFVLHIYDSSYDKEEQPVRLIPEETEIILKQGEKAQIRVFAEPSFSNCDLLYSSDHEETAEVDYFGVIHALSPGEAEITIRNTGDDHTETAVKIIVQ